MTYVQKASRINTPYKEIYGSNPARKQDQTTRDTSKRPRKSHRVGGYLRPEHADKLHEDATST